MIPHPDHPGVVQYDPDHEPALPAGAVRGDIRRQDYCPMCNVPRYFYVDEPRTCVQCSTPFVFTAVEQKYWYETLRFWADSTAIRCVDCRRRHRRNVAIQRHLCAALAALEQAPDDPVRLLEVAAARARYRAAWGRGDLASGLAAARRAQQLWPEEPRALYWEGRLQELAGRPDKARVCYRRFLAEARGQQADQAMRRHAERLLAAD
jgi:tetratricopeptide (TPR) repeat protein